MHLWPHRSAEGDGGVKRIVEMTDGTFCVQHKRLFWWLFDVTGDGVTEWLLSFDTEDEARKYIEDDRKDIKRVVEVFK